MAAEEVSSVVDDPSSVGAAHFHGPNSIIFTASELAMLDLMHKHRWSQRELKEVIETIKKDVFDPCDITPDLHSRLERAMSEKLFEV